MLDGRKDAWLLTFNVSQKLCISRWDIWLLPESCSHWLWNMWPLLGQDPGRNNKPNQHEKQLLPALVSLQAAYAFISLASLDLLPAAGIQTLQSERFDAGRRVKNVLINHFCQSAGQLTLGTTRCKLHGPLIHEFSSINTESVFSLPYNFLSNTLFSLAYLIVRIQSVIHIT